MTEEVNPFAGLTMPGTATASHSRGSRESAESDRPVDDHRFPRRGATPVTLKDLSVDLGQLREYNWAEQPWDDQTLEVKVSNASEAGWQVELSWDPAPLDIGTVAIYRVLVGEGHTPDPECADIEGTLLLTMECHAVDALWINPPDSAVRYYDVWCYYGDTLEGALSSPPLPLSSGHVVLPPTGITQYVDYGQVVLSWDGWEDPSRTVRVIRQDPREARAEGIPRPEEGDEAIGSQFVDEDVQPGGDYLYTVFAGVEVDGNLEWSQWSRKRVKVPADVKPVLDLQVLASGDGRTVDLCWTPVPGAEVRVYRSLRRPALEAHRLGPIDVAELTERVNLRATDLLPHRPVYETDKAWIRHVPIPPDSAELHFTPVTTVGQMCVPGRTLDWLSLRPPQEPFVEDRVEWLLVVFEWPVGATDVLLYPSGVGQLVRPAEREPLERISQDDHRVYGGFRVDRRQLTAGAFDIHLCSYRFSDGEHYSDLATITHHSPTLVRYEISTEPKFRGRRVLLTLTADEEVRDAQFRLVWHPTLLPLSLGDSERTLMQRTLNLRERQEVPIDLSAHGIDMPKAGFVRLISRPDQPIAVIDPPINQLCLRSG